MDKNEVYLYQDTSHYIYMYPIMETGHVLQKNHAYNFKGKEKHPYDLCLGMYLLGAEIYHSGK